MTGLHMFLARVLWGNWRVHTPLLLSYILMIPFFTLFENPYATQSVHCYARHMKAHSKLDHQWQTAPV